MHTTVTKGVCIKCNDCFNVKRGLQNVIALEYGGKACRKQRKQLQFYYRKDKREREKTITLVLKPAIQQ